MPKAKAGRRSGHGAGPYDKSQKSNNIFKMNKDFGQHILKNPGVSDVSLGVVHRICLPRIHTDEDQTRLLCKKPLYNLQTLSWK